MGAYDDILNPPLKKGAYEDILSPKGEAPSGFAMGLKDPIAAGVQLLSKVTPAPVESAIDRLNNWLASKGIPLATIPEGGVDELVRQQEQAYQGQRAASGATGIDWGRIAGNILNPANIAVASRLPQATTLAGRAGMGAVTGGIFGAAQPVTEGDFATEKTKQIGLGAVTGSVLPVITGAAARVVRPKTSPQVQQLMKEGVVPTPGQQIGGIPQAIEEKATSIPIIGEVIKSSQRMAIRDFNRAGINKVLEPLGQKLPKSMPVGRDAVDYAINQVDDAYNNLLPKLGGQLDDQLTGEINSLRSAITQSNIPEPLRGQFERIIQNEVTGRFTDAGKASGETIKMIESKLGELAKSYGRGDYDQQTISGALRETQSALRGMIERTNPNYSGELSKVNQAYANLMRIQGAASALGAKEGVFTPAQLLRTVKAQDISKNKRAFARGQAKMQEFAEAGKEVLSPTIPSSGTAERYLNAALLMNPKAWMSAAAALPVSAMYSRPVTSMITSRPEFATPLAQAIRQSTPFLTPGAIPLSDMIFRQKQ